MKVIGLQINNVLRVEEVDITPDGTLQIIGGRNAQGKSSVLNAIWLALGGRDAAKDVAKPLREGANVGRVRVDLGGLIVERVWTEDSTKLVVKSPDGATFSSPQKKLNDLLGRVGFDPLAFARMDPRSQKASLLDMVDLGVDLDELDQHRADLYEERRRFGQLRKSFGEIPEVPEGAPIDEDSAGDLLAEISEATDRNAMIKEKKNALGWARSERESVIAELQDLQARLTELDEQISEGEAWEKTPDAALVDLSDLHARLHSLEERNAAARANRAALDKQAEADALDLEYRLRTERIKEIDEKKTEALASANFPIDGLGFDEDGVTFNGIPFSQASSAEQVRVSAAMGMALNPDLRVMMVRDGSLLDADALAALREQVADADFQLFVERVGEGDEGAIIIEDGRVKE